MKCRLIRNDLDVDMSNPFGEEFTLANSVEDKTRNEPPYNERDVESGDIVERPGKPIRLWKWGTLIDHPVAWKLVAQGVALPDDDECRDRCGLTPEEITNRQEAYDHLKEHGSYADELSSPNIVIDDDE